MNTRFLTLISVLSLTTLSQAQAVELGSLALRSSLDVEADFTLNRNSSLLASVGASGLGGGFKYFLERNHSGFNLAARANAGFEGTGVAFAGTLGYRFLIPTDNRELRALELEVEGGPRLNVVGGRSATDTVVFLRAGIRLN